MCVCVLVRVGVCIGCVCERQRADGSCLNLNLSDVVTASFVYECSGKVFRMQQFPLTIIWLVGIAEIIIRPVKIVKIVVMG